MDIVTDRLSVSTRGDCEVLDLTSDIDALLRKHAFDEGQALIFCAGSTGGLTTVEYEPGLVRDLPEFFEKIAPQGAHYYHEDTWHDGNGHSHVRASLVGPSLTVPFEDGRLVLGTRQQIVLLDFDNKPRQRKIVVQLVGRRR